MRKHSKFITILLSALLAVCLMQTVFVQAFATENSATPDEPTDGLYPVSMKVVKAPESVTVNKGRITDSTFWSNVVLHIVYSNGEEYDVNCDGIDSEGGIVPPIAEINGYAGKLTWMYNDGYEDNNAIGFIINYDYVNLFGENVFISTEFSVKQVADPHSIARVEVTKLPDKVFTAPLWTGEPDYLPGEYYKWLDSLDINNSISHNCEGMEVTLYYANGEKCGTFAIADFKKNHIFNYLVNYILENFDEYGNALDMQVYDLGDYKFSVSLGSSDTEMIYTAKSVDNPSPSVKPVSTEDTPAKPAKPSDNNGSSTSDTATNDSTNNNNGNGTQNNGVVATGDFATPAIIATVMILAAAVMFVLKRKHTF
nr:hypothetical protein [Ruminococcus bromii]